MDGIRDPTTRVMVDSQVDEPYTLLAVLRAFSKSTKSIRRQELMNQQGNERQSSKMDATDIMMESMKNNQQMVCQVGELIKELQLSRQSASSHRSQPHIGYQPIVGTVGQQANVNRASAASSQNQLPFYNSHPQNQSSYNSHPQNQSSYNSHPQNQSSYNSPPQNQSAYNQPAHNQQAYANRQFRLRSEIKCFSCSEMGHRSPECNSKNLANQQEAGKQPEGSAPQKVPDPPVPRPAPTPAPA